MYDSSMKRASWCCLITVLVLGLSNCTFQNMPVHVIQLEQGAAPLELEDRLDGIHDAREFAFRAQAGTRVTIELSAPGGIRSVLTSPSGKREGGPGGGILTQELTETGEYRLRVTESPMGESWRGAFHLRLELIR